MKTDVIIKAINDLRTKVRSLHYDHQNANFKNQAKIKAKYDVALSEMETVTKALGELCEYDHILIKKQHDDSVEKIQQDHHERFMQLERTQTLKYENATHQKMLQLEMLRELDILRVHSLLSRLQNKSIDFELLFGNERLIWAMGDAIERYMSEKGMEWNKVDHENDVVSILTIHFKGKVFSAFKTDLQNALNMISHLKTNHLKSERIQKLINMGAQTVWHKKTSMLAIPIELKDTDIVRELTELYNEPIEIRAFAQNVSEVYEKDTDQN